MPVEYPLWRCTIKIQADDEKRYPPTPKKKTLKKRGALLFVDREVFDVHMVAGIDPTATRMYALPRYTILHISTFTVYI